MARHFRLAGLMRLRKLQEDQAAAALAEANQLRRQAERRRADTLSALSGSALPTQSDPQAWRASVAARAALNSLLVEASAASREAEAQVDVEQGRWSQAKARSTALEKLSERHDEQVAFEENRAEQYVLDEAAARGWVERDRDGEPR